MFMRIALLLLTVTVAGCIPSRTTLIDPREARADERLYGTWKHMQKEGKVLFLQIEKPEDRLVKDGMPPGFMKVTTWQQMPGEQPGNRKTSYFFTATVGENHYVHFVSEEAGMVALLKEKKVTGDPVILLKYTVKGDEVVVSSADLDRIETDIKNKVIKGMDKHVLTDTAANISKYLQENGKALFPEDNRILFNRVKKDGEE